MRRRRLVTSHVPEQRPRRGRAVPEAPTRALRSKIPRDELMRLADYVELVDCPSTRDFSRRNPQFREPVLNLVSSQFARKQLSDYQRFGSRRDV